MGKKIIIHHISLSKTSFNLSGGEKSEIEIVSYLDKKGFDNIIYTSESGKILYSRLKSYLKVSYVEIGAVKWERVNPYLAYYLRVFQLFKYLRKFDKKCENIILLHENFLPTIIFGCLLGLLNSSSKKIMIYHTKSPGIFKGFKGEFLNKIHIPDVKFLRFWIEEKIAFFLTSNFDKIITVNPYNLDHLYRFYNKEKVSVLRHFGGVSDDSPARINSKKEYALVFMGRFQELKGYKDIIPVVKYIRDKYDRNIKTVVLGGSDNKKESQFRKKIIDEHLESNIDYKGFISGEEKYRYIQNSELFLLPSYYESSPVVIFEAFHYGVPVIAYDLPVYKKFDKNIITSEIGNIEKISEQIINYLKDKDLLKKVSDKVIRYERAFSWEKTGQEISAIILKGTDRE